METRNLLLCPPREFRGLLPRGEGEVTARIVGRGSEPPRGFNEILGGRREPPRGQTEVLRGGLGSLPMT
eukprot:1178539-Prorocentrum_minimum.AAC.1